MHKPITALVVLFTYQIASLLYQVFYLSEGRQATGEAVKHWPVGTAPVTVGLVLVLLAAGWFAGKLLVGIFALKLSKRGRSLGLALLALAGATTAWSVYSSFAWRPVQAWSILGALLAAVVWTYVLASGVRAFFGARRAKG